MSYVPYLLILAAVCIAGGVWDMSGPWRRRRRERIRARRMAEVRRAFEAVQRASRPVSAAQLHDFAAGSVPASEVIDSE